MSIFTGLYCKFFYRIFNELCAKPYAGCGLEYVGNELKPRSTRYLMLLHVAVHAGTLCVGKSTKIMLNAIRLAPLETTYLTKKADLCDHLQKEIWWSLGGSNP